MKLHLPIRLLAALLMVMSFLQGLSAQEEVTFDVGNKTVTLGKDKNYEGGISVTVDNGETLKIETDIPGDSTITVNGGSVYHTAGRVACDSDNNLEVNMKGGYYEITGYAREAYSGTAAYTVDQRAKLLMRNGFFSCGGEGKTNIEVKGGSEFISNIGFGGHNGGEITITLSGVGTRAATQTAQMGFGFEDNKLDKQNEKENLKKGTANITVKDGATWEDRSWYGYGRGKGYTGVVNLTVQGAGSSFTMLDRSWIGFGSGGGTGEATIIIKDGGSMTMRGGKLCYSSNRDTSVDLEGRELSEQASAFGQATLDMKIGKVVDEALPEQLEEEATTAGGESVFTLSDGDIGQHSEGGKEMAEGTITIGEGGKMVQDGGAIWDGITVRVNEKGQFVHSSGTFNGTLELNKGTFEQRGGSFTGQLHFGAGSNFQHTSGSMGIDLHLVDATYTLSNGTIDDATNRTIQVSGNGKMIQNWDRLGDDAGNVTITVGGTSPTRAAVATAAEAAAVYELGVNGAFGEKTQVTVGRGGVLEVKSRVTEGGWTTLKAEVQDGGVLSVEGGWIIGGDITLKNGGKMTVTNESSDLNKSTVTIEDGATFDMGDGRLEIVTLDVNGGTATLGESVDVTGGTFKVRSGSFTQEAEFASSWLRETVELSGGSYKQLGGDSRVDVVVTGGVYTQENASFSDGTITVKEGSFTQSGDRVTTKNTQINLEGGVFTQMGSMSGTTLNMTGGTFNQNGTFTGALSIGGGQYNQNGSILSGNVSITQNATFIQHEDLGGKVTVDGGAYNQEAGDVDGGVLVSGGGTGTSKGTIDNGVSVVKGSFTQAGGVITGGVSVSDSESSFTQKKVGEDATSPEILGRVEVKTGGSFKMEDGHIASGLNVFNKGSSFTQSGGIVEGFIDFDYEATGVQTGGTILNIVNVRGGSTFTQRGDGVLNNGVSMVSTGSFIQEGGTIHGTTDVRWAATFTQKGGTVDLLSMTQKGSFTQSGTGLVKKAVVGNQHGNQYDTESVFTQEGGTVECLELLSGSFVQKDGEVGSLTMSGGTFEQSGGSISGDVSVAQAGKQEAKLVHSGGSIKGTVSLSGASSSFMFKGGDLSTDTKLVADASSRIDVQADGFGAQVTLRGGASLDLHGNNSTADVTLVDGNLSGANNLNGSLAVKSARSSLDLGQVKASSLKSVNLTAAGASLTKIGNGTITLEGMSSIRVGNGSTSVLNFNDPGKGEVTFAKGGQLVVDVDASLLKASSTDKTEVSFSLTNGTIISPDDFAKHLSLGAGLEEDEESAWTVRDGKVTVCISLKGLIFASSFQPQGLDADSPELKEQKKVFLDSGLTFHTNGKKATLKQLTAGVSSGTFPKLTVSGGGSLSLENKNTGEAQNGSTEVYGKIEVTDATELRKTGDASLTIFGELSSQGQVSVDEGNLILRGESSVNGLNVAAGSTVNVGGGLTISGGTSRVGGSVNGTGSVTLAGGDMTTEGTLEVSTLDLKGGTLTGKSGSIAAAVNVSGGALTLEEASLTGDVTLSGGSVSTGSGAVTGNLTVTGGTLTTGSGAVEGNISLTGGTWHSTGNGTLQGDVAVTGGSLQLTHPTSIRGSVDVELSEDVTYDFSGASIDGGVSLHAKVESVPDENATEGEERSKVKYTSPTNAQVMLGDVKGSVVLDVAGTKTSLKGKVEGGVTLKDGQLADAASFEGDLTIDLNENVKSPVSLGGVSADQITGILTRGQSGVRFTDLKDGSTLTFKGDANIVTIGSDCVGNEGESLFSFENGNGTLAFEDGAKLKLALSSNLFTNLENGDLVLHITDGDFQNGETDLLDWVKQHFLLATGSGLEFLAKDFIGADGGTVVLGLVKDNVDSSFVAKEGESNELDASAVSGYTKVVVGEGSDLTVQASAAKDAVVNQLEGAGSLKLTGTDGNVVLNNQSYDYYNGDTAFDGEISADAGVTLVKRGNADLKLTGDLNAGGSELKVEDGSLTLVGKDSAVGSLSMEEKASLTVDGKLTLNGDSNLGGGVLAGKGLLQVQKELTIGENVKLNDGPSMKVEDGAKLVIRCKEAATIGALSGEGDLALNTNTLHLSRGEGVFTGEIRTSGDTTINLTGDVNQTFVDLQNERLTIESKDEHTVLTLRGEVELKSLQTSGHLIIDGHVITHSAELTNNVTTFSLQLKNGQDDKALMVDNNEKGLTLGSSTVLAVEIGAENVSFNSNKLDMTLLANSNGIVKEGTDGGRYMDGERILNALFTPLLTYYYNNLELIAVYDAAYDPNNQAEIMALELEENGEGSQQEANSVKVQGDATDKSGQLMNAANSHNSASGAKLLVNALQNCKDEISMDDDSIYSSIWQNIEEGNVTRAATQMAAVAGTSLVAPGLALRDEVRDNLLRVRDHALQSEASGTPVGKFSAWVAAEGDFREMDSDGDETGYEINTWGGSVGADKRITESTTIGLALTALYGDLDANSADVATGSLDSYWLSLYLHTSTRKAWGHTVVISGGVASADLDRTVNYDNGSYSTTGSTDGYGLGLLYELTYDANLNEEKSQKIRPYFNAAITYSALDGWAESSPDGGVCLNVDDHDIFLAHFSLGVRWIADLSSNAIARSIHTMLGVGVAQDVGDSRSEADVALQMQPGEVASIRSAEAGSTSLQLEAGISVPIATSTLIYLNGHGDIRSNASSWSVGLGVRHSF